MGLSYWWRLHLLPAIFRSAEALLAYRTTPAGQRALAPSRNSAVMSETNTIGEVRSNS